MTETTTANATETCNLGRRTDNPCRFPASTTTEWGSRVCAFHAALEPLIQESEEMSLALELLDGYIENTHRESSFELLDVLRRIKSDFSHRLTLADMVRTDLRAAELRDMRS